MSGPRRRSHTYGAFSEFGEYVVSRRHALQLTQQEVADLADVNISSVRALERGQSSTTLAVTSQILEALGLTLIGMTRAEVHAVPRAVEIRQKRGGE